jgi:hypothetical protein
MKPLEAWMTQWWEFPATATKASYSGDEALEAWMRRR